MSESLQEFRDKYGPARLTQTNEYNFQDNYEKYSYQVILLRQFIQILANNDDTTSKANLVLILCKYLNKRNNTEKYTLEEQLQYIEFEQSLNYPSSRSQSLIADCDDIYDSLQLVSDIGIILNNQSLIVDCDDIYDSLQLVSHIGTSPNNQSLIADCEIYDSLQLVSEADLLQQLSCISTHEQGKNNHLGHENVRRLSEYYEPNIFLEEDGRVIHSCDDSIHKIDYILDQ